MIKNQWYVILESNEIKPGKPVGVTRMGEKMVAWRDSAGKAAVMSDLCPHRGGSAFNWRGQRRLHSVSISWL